MFCNEEYNDTCYLIMSQDVLLKDFVDEGDNFISSTFPIGDKGHRMKIVIKKFID